ncbi:ImmA/IrrE family metallo-endopeptidase [Helicobacter jaachi]|uniref:ImmA/IrrE family metallo-endopeptidase n=1 Tax=Helicobacter jaachi TaxID=1677920 RepID=A0A4U8T4P4_9HELI|nr:ImmA/IrrE family metallo-endopeptidase [Helicobacter jaachi]TLD94490.1 ImmA/IrrE family metallo-endopeptidase [Helicobacter jaachi]
MGLTKKEIALRAQKTLKAHSDGEYPIKVVDLAHAMGLRVMETKFTKDSIAGLLDMNERTIYIAKSEGYARKRFSIAHEIGHYVLHKEECQKEGRHISYRDEISSLGFEIKEIEANFFAANLLMPKESVMSLVLEGYTLEEMAHYFNVSNVSMGYRLKFLGVE